MLQTSPFRFLGRCNLYGFLLLHGALPDEILVQILTVLVSMGCVTDTVGILACKSLESFRSGTVIVEKTMDALIDRQPVNRFCKIGDRIQYDIVLPVQTRHFGTLLRAYGQEREIVRKSLKHETGIIPSAFMPDMGDVLRRDAALEVSVAYLKTASHVPKTDGKITLAVVLEVYFATFSFRQFQVYSPALQVGEQDGRSKFPYFHALKIRLCGGLLPKREGHGSDVRCLFRNPLQQVRNVDGTVKLRSQCDDITTLSQPEVIPFIDCKRLRDSI